MKAHHSRHDLLQMSPATLFQGGLRSGDAKDDTGLTEELIYVGALAFAEQVVEAGIPVQTIDLVMVHLDQVRDRAEFGKDLPPEALSRLTALVRTDVESSGSPILRAWTGDILEHVATERDLSAAIRFLERARYLVSVRLATPQVLPPSPGSPSPAANTEPPADLPAALLPPTHPEDD